MTTGFQQTRVGELRPSQILLSFGVGSIIDLPNLAVMLMGLDDWEMTHSVEIAEPRLLAEVRRHVGAQLERLRTPPLTPDGAFLAGPFDDASRVGVPVASFPRWLVCPACRLLAPIASGLFELKLHAFHPDRTQYVHQNCQKTGRPPAVNPARFLVACARGHLDDFPWVAFVHRGGQCGRSVLRFEESGVASEAVDVWVRCDGCNTSRPMAEAFGEDGKQNVPACTGRRPHLRDHEEGCNEQAKAILLGASNGWFPIVLSSLSVPSSTERLAQLVEAHWHVLGHATSREIVIAFHATGQLRGLSEFTDDEVWAAVQAHRSRQAGGPAVEGASRGLKPPEWEVLVDRTRQWNAVDFRVREVAAPAAYARQIARVVLVERMREVRALIGFTRVESPGNMDDEEYVAPERRMTLSRTPPRWLPASEVRGEGVFIQFDEERIARWMRSAAAMELERSFLRAHRRWRGRRNLTPEEAGFPGARFVLLHSFSHVLMRQLAVECGYSAASIRERIYAAEPGDPEGPMAGVLIYTAATDSEGTLGGLVSLGEPAALERLMTEAFRIAELCASDPLCAEHEVGTHTDSLHGAACHACMFSPETSCERANRYLDRGSLVHTVRGATAAFFGADD